MGVLALTPQTAADLRSLVTYANEPTHWYHPDTTPIAPGYYPEHVRIIGTYRVVYSMTVHDGKRFRHLTVSSLLGRTPNARFSLTLAGLCGFTGAKMRAGGDPLVEKPGVDWQIAVDDVEGIVTIIQDLPADANERDEPIDGKADREAVHA